MGNLQSLVIGRMRVITGMIYRLVDKRKRGKTDMNIQTGGYETKKTGNVQTLMMRRMKLKTGLIHTLVDREKRNMIHRLVERIKKRKNGQRKNFDNTENENKNRLVDRRKKIKYGKLTNFSDEDNESKNGYDTHTGE